MSINVHEMLRDLKDPRTSPLRKCRQSSSRQEDGGLRARPGQAAAPTTRTGLVSDKEDDSRSGNKIYKTPPPGVQAQPKG